MTLYLINGSEASIGPTNVRWIPFPLGQDHNGQPLYSLNYDVELRFAAGASTDDANQWLLNTSSGSIDLALPNRWGLDFTDLSGVYVEITEPPVLEDVHMSEWSLLVHGAQI